MAASTGAYTFQQWLASRGSIDRVWYTTKYEEGFLDKEARTVMFGKELIDIFKQLRGLLVRCFNSKSYYLRLRQNMRIDVETVNNMDLVRVSIIGTEIYYEAGFEDGVKQNMQDLFRMVDRIPEYCPAPPHDRNSQLMFEYFKKEYRNLEGLKGGDLFKKVFFILSHPNFFDLEDITRFTYTCHRLYIKNADRFVADIQHDGELSIRGWAEYICDNNGQSLHNVLVHCLRYKGPGVYHDPFNPIYREPYSVVIFMRNLLRHRNIVAEQNEETWRMLPLDDSMMSMLYHLGYFGVLPKLLFALMVNLEQNDYWQSLINDLNDCTWGMKYAVN